MPVEMQWHGKEAMAKVEHALQMAIDKTTSDGAIEAKGLVHLDTTTLQGSIWPEGSKKNKDGQMEGAYGAHTANNPESNVDVMSYAIWQEFLPGEALPDPPGGIRTRAGGKPYLRPTIPKAQKELPINIANEYKKVE